MTSICRAWWAALVLAAIAGCNTEESAPVDPPAPVPSAVPDTSSTATTPQAPEAPNPGSAPAPQGEAPAVDAPAGDAPKAGTPEAAAVSLSEEEIAEIRKLPSADQAVALKQLVCPVSGENLGSMDKPVKVAAKGQEFFLCCSGCEKAVKSDPDAVLAKLKK